MPSEQKVVLFKETEEESLWSIYVDGKLIEDNLRSDQFEIADIPSSLWNALGIEIGFEYAKP